jgi:hypothetical protein
MTYDPEPSEPGKRVMRRLAAAMTPAERIERMARIEQSCFALLSSSPEAFARFWRRNLRKRAVRVAEVMPRSKEWK